MGRNTRLTPYGEENVEGFDEEASVSKFMSYRSTPSNPNCSFPPEESVPLFLSDYDDEEPQPPSFGRPSRIGRLSRRALSSGPAFWRQQRQVSFSSSCP